MTSWSRPKIWYFLRLLRVLEIDCLTLDSHLSCYCCWTFVRPNRRWSRLILLKFDGSNPSNIFLPCLVCILLKTPSKVKFRLQRSTFVARIYNTHTKFYQFVVLDVESDQCAATCKSFFQNLTNFFSANKTWNDLLRNNPRGRRSQNRHLLKET